MKKSNYITLVLGIIGGLITSIGMCMCLIPEWNSFDNGIITGIVGLVILFADFIYYRKANNKAPIKFSKKAIITTLVAICGTLLLGIGMSLVTVGSNLVLGTVIGVVGIVVLLSLIPLTKGLK